MTALLGGEALVGIPDPFYGWLAVEVEEALVKARADLAARGAITVASDGRVTASPAVESLVNACLFPHASFRLSCTTPGGQAPERYFHLTPDMVVELVSAGEQAELVPYPGGGEALCRRLTGLLDLHSNSIPGAEPTTVPAEQYWQAQALDEGSSTWTVLRLTRKGAAWDVSGVGVHVGAGGLWRIQPEERSGQAWLELRPCTADEIHEAIADLCQ
ncbi:MAG TPA: hypothetical protein VD902_22125 [Symbiobacteriaceae bacterium]|nr:hypothetical protein [Symbiobacteriaceae bacterium]